LAAGLDKYRTDTSLLIWDINRKGSEGSGSELGKVVREYGKVIFIWELHFF